MKQHVSWIIALVVGFGLGAITVATTGLRFGKEAPEQPSVQAPSAPGAARPRLGEDPQAVYRVPLEDSPSKGPADALVTVVVSSDFQCPFCKKVEPTLKQLEEAYPGKLRFVWKNNPLTSIHPLAMNAALAAEEARAQGGDAKFWAMHDRLFAAPPAANGQGPAIDVPDLERMGQELGLDVEKLKTAISGQKWADRIARDQRLVTSLRATGTPAFFVNGRKLSGAQPLEAFKRVVDQELVKAQALVKAGTPAAKVYDTIMASAAASPVMLAQPAEPSPQAEAPRPSAPPPAPSRKVTLRPDDPAKGPKDAKVTVVVFSDFQCPFCGRVEPTLKQLEQAYQGQVRFVWKHQPLPMHPNAVPAGLAAEAAREQGKFWEMHDKLFAGQAALSGALDPGLFERYAAELKLDVPKFKAAVAARHGQDRMQADQQLAGSLGVNGTPTMFFNCRQLVGAVPFETMKGVMDDELKKADVLLKGAKPGADFYQKACDANVASAPAAAAEPAAPAANVPSSALALRPDDPARGSAKAPVTLVVFSDFQCPFCGRVEPTLAEVEKTYGDKVRVVWKHQPLPMHPQAIPAAEAAAAAREPGKFWQMHDKLFENQRQLSDGVYTQLAKDVGLDLAQFEASRKSGKGRARIQEDQAIAGRVGVDGTPTLFVNGERVVGAVPFDTLKAAIDRQLQLAKK
jgi:protein-disulfide isomerase